MVARWENKIMGIVSFLFFKEKNSFFWADKNYSVGRKSFDRGEIFWGHVLKYVT